MFSLSRLLIINTFGNKYLRQRLFKLKDNNGTQLNGYTLVLNTISMGLKRRFLTVRRMKFWNSFPNKEVGARNINYFKMEPDLLMERDDRIGVILELEIKCGLRFQLLVLFVYTSGG